MEVSWDQMVNCRYLLHLFLSDPYPLFELSLDNTRPLKDTFGYMAINKNFWTNTIKIINAIPQISRWTTDDNKRLSDKIFAVGYESMTLLCVDDKLKRYSVTG